MARVGRQQLWAHASKAAAVLYQWAAARWPRPLAQTTDRPCIQTLIAAVIVRHAPFWRDHRIELVPLPELVTDLATQHGTAGLCRGGEPPAAMDWDLWAHVELASWDSRDAAVAGIAEPEPWHTWRRGAYAVTATHLVDALSRGQHGPYHHLDLDAALTKPPTLAQRLNPTTPAPPPLPPPEHLDSRTLTTLIRRSRRRLAAADLHPSTGEGIWAAAPQAIGQSRHDLAPWPTTRHLLGPHLDQALVTGNAQHLANLLRTSIERLDLALG